MRETVIRRQGQIRVTGQLEVSGTAWADDARRSVRAMDWGKREEDEVARSRVRAKTLPITTHRLTRNRSPHGNKTARDQWALTSRVQRVGETVQGPTREVVEAARRRRLSVRGVLQREGREVSWTTSMAIEEGQ